jgi:hypothetical protein
MAPVVAAIIDQAIEQAGKALALAAKIEPLLGRSYAGRTVSACVLVLEGRAYP